MAINAMFFKATFDTVIKEFTGAVSAVSACSVCCWFISCQATETGAVVKRLTEAAGIRFMTRNNQIKHGGIRGAPIHPNPLFEVFRRLCRKLKVVLIKSKAWEFC